MFMGWLLYIYMLGVCGVLSTFSIVIVIIGDVFAEVLHARRFFQILLMYWVSGWFGGLSDFWGLG